MFKYNLTYLYLPVSGSMQISFFCHWGVWGVTARGLFSIVLQCQFKNLNFPREVGSGSPRMTRPAPPLSRSMHARVSLIYEQI